MLLTQVWEKGKHLKLSSRQESWFTQNISSKFSLRIKQSKIIVTAWNALRNKLHVVVSYIARFVSMHL